MVCTTTLMFIEHKIYNIKVYDCIMHIFIKFQYNFHQNSFEIILKRSFNSIESSLTLQLNGIVFNFASVYLLSLSFIRNQYRVRTVYLFFRCKCKCNAKAQAMTIWKELQDSRTQEKKSKELCCNVWSLFLTLRRFPPSPFIFKINSRRKQNIAPLSKMTGFMDNTNKTKSAYLMTFINLIEFLTCTINIPLHCITKLPKTSCFITLIKIE